MKESISLSLETIGVGRQRGCVKPEGTTSKYIGGSVESKGGKCKKQSSPIGASVYLVCLNNYNGAIQTYFI